MGTTITERVRETLQAAITCPTCGQRRMTIGQVAGRIDGYNTTGAPKVTEAIVGAFLRGGHVRSDILDLIDKALQEEKDLGAQP